METIKINNPLYVGQIAPLIQRYWEKINVHKLNYVTYETLCAYITNTVQHGGDIAEFWVCLNEDRPVGFALWSVLPLPFVGTVYCQHIFKTVKDHNVALELVKQFVKFGKKHNAPYYMFHSINDIVAKLLVKLANEVNATTTNLGTTEFIARLRENK